MRKLRLSVLACAVAGVAMLAGCSSPEKMKDVPEDMRPIMTPNPLVLRGKMVEGKVTGKFPPKYFHKKGKLDINPVLVYEGQELVLNTWQYQGEEVAENQTVISFDNGGSFGGDFSFEYKPEMMQSKVELRLTLMYKDQAMPFAVPFALGEGIDVTQLLVDDTPQVAMMAHDYVRTTEETAEAEVHFAIQRNDISRSELTQDDVMAFQKVLSELHENEKLKLKGVAVSAYSSPDGPVELNEKLYKGRGSNTEKFVEQTLKKSKVDTELVSIAEEDIDWDGFKALVEASDIEDKDMIIRVLNMYSDPVTRNKEMHNMGKVFKVVAEKILPKLRRAKMVARFEKVGRTDDEIRDLISNQHVSDLTLTEALYGATLFGDLDMQEAIYLELVKNHNDIRVYNNVACVYIQKKNFEAAKNMLAKAAEINAENPFVLNNLGVLEMNAGNNSEAKALFLRAGAAGAVVRANLGICSIKDGEYGNAVEYLAGMDSFNQGLALLLADKNDAAKNVFADVRTAKAYYAMAIIGVRARDEKMVLDNMRTAIEMDGALKERAKKDVVFAGYKQNEAFAFLLQ